MLDQSLEPVLGGKTSSSRECCFLCRVYHFASLRDAIIGKHYLFFSVLLSKRMHFVNLIQTSEPMHRVLFCVLRKLLPGLTTVADMEKTTSS